MPIRQDFKNIAASVLLCTEEAHPYISVLSISRSGDAFKKKKKKSLIQSLDAACWAPERHHEPSDDTGDPFPSPVPRKECVCGRVWAGDVLSSELSVSRVSVSPLESPPLFLLVSKPAAAVARVRYKIYMHTSNIIYPPFPPNPEPHSGTAKIQTVCIGKKMSLNPRWLIITVIVIIIQFNTQSGTFTMAVEQKVLKASLHPWAPPSPLWNNNYGDQVSVKEHETSEKQGLSIFWMRSVTSTHAHTCTHICRTVETCSHGNSFNIYSKQHRNREPHKARSWKRAPLSVIYEQTQRAQCTHLHLSMRELHSKY